MRNKKRDYVLIARNIQLTFKLCAREIYVSRDGEVTIVLQHFGPKTDLPEITLNYLEAVCSKFYYGGYTHQDAIADIMLLNSVLSLRDYDDFYESLDENLKNGNVTVISSTLFR